MSAIDMETLGRLARSALAANEPYVFCRVVPVLAEASPENPEWVLGYVKSLVRLGLGAAARRLVDHFDGAMQEPAQFRELVGAIGRGPDGLVPWASRRRRFEANLKALATQDREAADRVREAWRTARERFELHQCVDGNSQIRELLPLWPPGWVASLDDHRGLAAGRVRTERSGLMPPPLVFEGVGLGWSILEGYRRTRRVFLEASSAIYVLEQSPEALGMVFHVHDWRGLLGDESVVWFVGTDATERFERLLEVEASWPLTDRHCLSDAGEVALQVAAVSAMQRVATRRRSRAEELRRKISRRYAGRNAEYWADRFADAAAGGGLARGRPLRVLGVTSLHTTFLQYSMRDCLQALEGLGHETRLVMEPAAHRCLDPLEALGVQAEFEPDVVLLLSRMRYEMPELIHEGIPSMTWDQDTLPWVFDAAGKPVLAWNDFLMGYAAGSAERKFGWPGHRLMFCPMAGSPETYSSEPLSTQELEPYVCDVSYVSHASAPVEEEFHHAESWLPEGRLQKLFGVAASRMIPGWLAGAAYPGRTMPVILETATELGIEVSADQAQKVAVALARIGDRAFRHVALEWVADWADRTGRVLCLWGNGWDRHPRLGRYARGATRNGHELRCVYQGSRINLQLMGSGFIHQRALDGLMAGGFFMARRSLADVQGVGMRELMALIEKHGVTNGSELMAIEDTPTRERMESILIQHGRDPRMLDAEGIDILRVNARTPCAAEVIPFLGDITFGDAEEFARRADRFLEDTDRCSRYAADMREALIERYSYRTRMVEMIRFLRAGFAVEAGCGIESPAATPASLAR